MIISLKGRSVWPDSYALKAIDDVAYIPISCRKQRVTATAVHHPAGEKKEKTKSDLFMHSFCVSVQETEGRYH